jgi:hypothetical protein
MYFADTHDYKMDVDQADEDAAEEFCTRENSYGCSTQFETKCMNVMLEHSQSFPTNYREALALFEWLVSYFDN